MPATLRRKHRQDLTLRKSFLEAMQAKLSSSFFLAFHRSSEKSSPRSSESRRRDRIPSYDLHYRPLPVQHLANAFYAPSHSIRILPPEILAYIFILGSEDDPILPLSVSHVCRFWRSLSINTPPLWRRVVLGSHYSLWRETMYRARACTLDQRYMHLVMPHIRRWRSLHIMFLEYQPYLWNSALSECCSDHTRVPELEELCLVYRHNDDTKEFCLFSGNAPRLRRVTVDGIRLTWLPSLFQNLTYLDYTHHGLTSGYHAIQEICNILHVSSRLVELRILFPGKAHRAHPANARISPAFGTLYLPWLKTLHLRVESRDIPEDLMGLVSVFNTPRLLELLLVDNGTHRSAFQSINTFWTLYRTPPSLRILHLQNGWYTEEVVMFFSQVASLEWLMLRRGNKESTHWLRERRGPTSRIHTKLL
ncbi:hypothetical protein BT96DRAFT_923230 [Gymnopus androsaceus JB14]|uniref:F-box domain-containing protein n=1 Tax=Gymnopus androsaceus JB14 TaxID=1447944 RepID=A0A6A4HAS8_9AGAR|nr:hypothetical protein BT96DRAFT_923230 [Gymnopus androsaceus JB14]